MPNRDHGPGEGSSSEDKYGWLYGGPSDSSSPPASPPRSDLPPPALPPPSWASTRDASSRSGGGGPVPPTDRRASRSPRPKGNGRRTRRIVLALVLAWVVFLVAVPIWAWSKINKVDAAPDGDRPGEQPGQTFLLVGSDSRAGLSKEQQKQLTTGSVGGNRTDTIMLMHTGSGPTLLLSIPRDSQVQIPGRGRGKINSAYAIGGPKLLVETIEENTGVRVDDYVEIGFGGFVNIVDAVGGVQICPKKNLKDKDAGINLKAGCQEADGPTALGYARSRKQYADSDISRVQSQREVLGAIAGEAKSPWTVLNPVRYARVAGSGASSLTIGEDVGPLALGRFALGLSSAMGGGGLNCTVPIADLSVRWDRERALKMFGYIKQDRTADIGDLCTANGQVGG
ncbi:LCP family protein [Solicola sp. PLA-1-18]|uniref:LCP family protein n=1 Tax=Solicola sp. PLA-1-18 TaxID=3380532 RepID=UPI003B80054B